MSKVAPEHTVIDKADYFRQLQNKQAAKAIVHSESKVAPEHMVIDASSRFLQRRINSDAVGRLIVAMNAIRTWTKEKRTIQENLLQRLEKENYYFFRGNLRTYPIFTTGGSLLYQVPQNKNGHLARFRDKTIRLLRLRSGGFGTAHFAAKALAHS